MLSTHQLIKLSLLLCAITLSVGEPMASAREADTTKGMLEPRAIDLVDGIDYNIKNLMSFTGQLGGRAPDITNSGKAARPYAVNGFDFPDFATAFARSCAQQADDCSKQANTATMNPRPTLNECQQQLKTCENAAKTAKHQNFQILKKTTDDAYTFCNS